jgi:hypothetical protein
VLTAPDGTAVAVDDGPGADIRAVPRGLVGVLLRPFAWDRTPNTSVLIAKLENFAWYLLYALALIGVWALRRDRRPVAYPTIMALGIIAVAALTQGNVGTAFRHRGQILWVLAMLAAAGAHHLTSRPRRA